MMKQQFQFLIFSYLLCKFQKRFSSQLQHLFFSASLHTGNGDQQLPVQTVTCLLSKLSLHRFSSEVRVLQYSGKILTKLGSFMKIQGIFTPFFATKAEKLYDRFHKKTYLIANCIAHIKTCSPASKIILQSCLIILPIIFTLDIILNE